MVQSILVPDRLQTDHGMLPEGRAILDGLSHLPKLSLLKDSMLVEYKIVQVFLQL